MDLIRTVTATAGGLLYAAVSTALQVLPVRYRKRAFYFLDLQAALAGLVFGQLLPELRPPHVDLQGKVALVTGANSGIGLSIATGLAARGASVYLGCRSQSRASSAREEILRKLPNSAERIRIVRLDTSDLDSIRDCVKTFTAQQVRLDVLVHNAGISTPPAGTEFSPQGFEIVYATNFLGSFLLTSRLEDHLSPTARVVLTASHGQYAGRFAPTFATDQVKGRREDGFHCPPLSPVGKSYQGCYANTKAMQCAFAKLLQRRFDGQAARKHGPRRVAHAFTPGFTSTAIFSKTASGEDPGFAFLKATEGLLATRVDQGAATGLWLASTDDEAVTGPGRGGRYWDRMTAKSCSSDLLAEETLARLWTRWEADAGVEWR